ncbi:hypothetical protein [Streptomyces sp900129855]|uniref:Uncharacterized protein n=1 Tax=Streptomyces sp. 900129855 TaxID=3155129 RepID=A0ABV2ZAB9_9ACTN
MACAESTALLRDDQRVLVDAPGRLPSRQRETLVPRHRPGLKERDAVRPGSPSRLHP